MGAWRIGEIPTSPPADRGEWTGRPRGEGAEAGEGNPKGDCGCRDTLGRIPGMPMILDPCEEGRRVASRGCRTGRTNCWAVSLPPPPCEASGGGSTCSCLGWMGGGSKSFPAGRLMPDIQHSCL